MNLRRWPGPWLAIQFLWALPLTALGFLIVILTWYFDRKQRVSHVQYAQAAIVFVVYGKLLYKLLRRHPLGHMQAVALGCCILAQDAACAQSTLTHELVHVGQALRWGVLFPFAYVLASLWAWARGGDLYRDNVFERAAFAAERASENRF